MEIRRSNLVAGCGVLFLILFCLGSGLLLSPPLVNINTRVVNTLTPTSTASVTPSPTNTSEASLIVTDFPFGVFPLAGTIQPAQTGAATNTGNPTLSAPFELVSYSTQVNVNNQAYMSIRTAPGANCSISFVSPIGRPIKAKELSPKVADNKGYCYWSWKIGFNTAAGKGSITVQANGLEKSYSITIAK
jgi:hypothetical protein